MSNSEFKGFVNYKTTVADLISDLEKEKELCLRLGLEKNAGLIEESIIKLKSDDFSVAILGEFNRGKSTLINALLEKDVLPTSWKPCTATINRVVYNITPAARVEYKDGRAENIDFDRIKSYVTKLSEEDEKTALSVKEVTIGYPLAYCKNGVSIYDTPGLNDDANMTEVTLSVLPKVDAAVMVIMANIPFGQTERTFLESKLIAGDVGRVVFAVTGIDIVYQNGGEEAVREVLDDVRKKIEHGILAKSKELFGEDSVQYAECKRKLGDVKIFGISAKQALDAKIKGDQALLEQSRFTRFEKELERFLTEDRGAIMLSSPISRLNTSGTELVKAIAMRKSTLASDANQFEEKYKDAVGKIEAIRESRKSEMKNVNISANKTYAELSDKISDYWDSIAKEAHSAIDGYTITGDMLKNDKTIDAMKSEMLETVKSAMMRRAQLNSERIQSIIESSLTQEIDRLGDFENYFFESTNDIQGMFIDKKESDNSTTKTIENVVLGGLNSFSLGLGGGVVSGYKAAGWKGALVGGASSFVGTFGTAIAADVVLGAIGLTIAAPVAIVLAIGAGIVGLFGSKKVVDAVFRNDRIDQCRKAMTEFVDKQILEMKASNDIAGVIKKQVETAFNALKNKITNETEAVLTDLQAQLDTLNVEIGRDKAEREKTVAELTDAEDSLKSIAQRVGRLSAQLSDILSSENKGGNDQ